MRLTIIKYVSVFIAALSALSLGVHAQKVDDAAAAVAVVDQLFAEMAAANPAGILAVHTADPQLVALFKQPSGGSRIQAIGGRQFADMFADKTKVLKEEMYGPKVEVHGDLALVWGRYVFFADGKLSHCGVNTFNLVRTEAGWKIANGASTIDRNGCTDAEKLRKPTPEKPAADKPGAEKMRPQKQP